MADALANQLKNLMANMFAEGYLDDQFHQLQKLRDESTPDFVGEVITLFCQDGERIISDLAKLLNQPVVNLDKLDVFVHQLKGSSASVGAPRVKDTCTQFREFCAQKNTDGCLKALDAVGNEFYDLCNKFQTMLQLEKQIQSSFPKH